MKNKQIFKRWELKYILSLEQYEKLVSLMEEHMIMDKYKKHKISNIYFDTADYKIIRTSIEKPLYKEKLRIRKYNDNTSVFIELKKKFNGIVYKRRIEVEDDVLNKNIYNLKEKNQINNEINYFLKQHDEIDARVYLSYERIAYYGRLDKEFRMTFDFNIKYRGESISFLEDVNQDKEVLSNEYVLLEVKTASGLPSWLLEFFSKNQIYKTSFSKYGTAYKKYIFPKVMHERSL